MKRRALASIALLACTAGMASAADKPMAVVRDLAARWTAAYNNGDAAKVAELYAIDATFLSGVLGALKGRQDIEAAISRSVKQLPRITFIAREAHQDGDVLWGYWDYTFADGPSGYGAITAVREAGVWRIAQHVSNVKPKAQ